jgi:hypothetical protein
MADEGGLERRIRERAYRLWEAEGRPEGRDLAHWEEARMLIAVEDGHRSTLRPVREPPAEPIEAVQNQGEFPTLTDQGEQQQVPRRPGQERNQERKWSAYGRRIGTMLSRR